MGAWEEAPVEIIDPHWLDGRVWEEGYEYPEKVVHDLEEASFNEPSTSEGGAILEQTVMHVGRRHRYCRYESESSDSDAEERMLEAQERAVRRMIRQDELKESKACLQAYRETAFSWYVRAYQAEREHHVEDTSVLQYTYEGGLNDFVEYTPCIQGIKKANKAVRRLTTRHSTIMKALQRKMMEFYNSRKPEEEQAIAQNNLIRILNDQLNPHFPDFTVEPYGGSHNGYGTKHSDMDLTLYCNEFVKNKMTVTEVLKILETPENKQVSGLSEVEDLEDKGIPLAKMLFKNGLEMEVDFTIQNFKGVLNTKLLALYSRIDKRASQLLYTIKAWAKTNNLHGGPLYRYNTYTLVLLVINFLQKGVQPAVLPHLHEMVPDLQLKLADHTLEEIEAMFSWDSRQQQMTLAELLISFMAYYGQYDFNEWSVDIRCSQLKNRNSVMMIGYENPKSQLSIRCPVKGRCPTRSASEECYKDFRKAINEFNRIVWKEMGTKSRRNNRVVAEKLLSQLGI